uniref:VASt domain-containing protein n=1 Tax=Parastrongyloides trichosuri TaxID=131310 RepID=A0A0N4ZU37_PARTI
MDVNCNFSNQISNSLMRRTSNQSIDSGVTNSNTTSTLNLSDQKSPGFDYISKAIMALSTKTLIEHQNFFKWNFDKKIPDTESILMAIPCYESDDISKNGFIYITPKYFAYSSTQKQEYFGIDKIVTLNKNISTDEGNNYLEINIDNGTTYTFYGITEILDVYWLIYELKNLKWDKVYEKKGGSNGFTRRIKSTIKLKNYKKYFNSKYNLRKSKSLDKLEEKNYYDDNKIPQCKNKDTLKALINLAKKEQIANGKIKNKKKSQIVKAYNSITRRKSKIPFLDINSVKTNETDQLSFSDLSSSIDREEDSTSATNSCTVSSSPSINENEKNFDVCVKEENIVSNYPVICDCPDHPGRSHIDAIYNIPVKLLFQLLFTKEPWYEQLRDVLLTFPKDMTIFSKINKANTEDWKVIDSDSHNNYKRTVKFSMAFSQALFSGKIDVREEQRLYPIKGNYKYGCRMIKNVYNTGVPMADSFYVEMIYCLSKHSETETHLKVHGNVIMHKQKGFFATIKSSIPFDSITQSGLAEHYTALDRLLKNICNDNEMYNDFVSILTKNESIKELPLPCQESFNGNDTNLRVINNLNDSTLGDATLLGTFDQTSLNLLNQIKGVIKETVISQNKIHLKGGVLSNNELLIKNVENMNIKLNELTNQLRIIMIIVVLSVICQVYYFIHSIILA